MLYRDGPDRSLDRPAHVRAGSGLSWIGDRLVLVQDDANFVAVVDPATGLAESITLPAGEAGLRQFDDQRGNKKFKLDLEACCGLLGPAGPLLIALGSGSKKRRRQVAIVDEWARAAPRADPRVTLVAADDLYRSLERASDFAGSDMNIEGVLALRSTVRLFGRGNGAPHRGLVPLNATCDLSITALLAYLGGTDAQPAPTPALITQYDLGSLDGLALGFTDAALCDGTVFYAAAAEDSSNSADDGRVSGSVLGVIPARRAPRYAVLGDVAGAALREKVEGVAPVPGAPDRLFVAIDADDAARPSELCEVRLEGPWT